MRKRQSYKKVLATHKAIFQDLEKKPEKGEARNSHLVMTDEEIDREFSRLSKASRSQMKKEAAVWRLKQEVLKLMQAEREQERELQNVRNE